MCRKGSDWINVQADDLNARFKELVGEDYTVKDLLGVDFKPADDFPQDDTGYGFDTIGDVLSLSVVQMEKYLSAAETVARTAVYGPQDVKATMVKYQPAGRRRPGDFDNLFFNTHPWLSVTLHSQA